MSRGNIILRHLQSVKLMLVDAVGSNWLGSFWHPIISARQPGELYKSR